MTRGSLVTLSVLAKGVCLSRGVLPVWNLKQYKSRPAVETDRGWGLGIFMKRLIGASPNIPLLGM